MRLFLCSGLLLLLISAPAYAAPGPDAMRDLARRQEQIIRQQEERRRLQEQDFFQGRDAAPSGQQMQPLPHVQDQKDAPCMDVKSVVINGVTLLSPATLRTISSSYENRCLSLADVNNLLRDITNLYIDKGYITSRAFVDPEKQSPGVLTVMVVEGTIEKIIINDGDKNFLHRGKTAFPGLVGGPLNLRDIEQGIDQLNRMPSGNASMELAPGEKLGGTSIKVKIPEAKSWRAGIGVDNLGQRDTGQFQYTLSLEKDNLMGIGDQFAVYWMEDAPFLTSSLAPHPNTGHNHSFSAYASIPWGYWTFSANMSRFSYETTISGLDNEFSSTGDTTVYSLQAERVIHRDADSKTSLSFGMTSREVDSFIEGVKLDVSSYRLTTLEAGVSHNRRMLGGIAGLRLGYARGVPLFGAEGQDEYGYSVPRREFDKYTAQLTWYRPFSAWERSLYWTFTAQGQMTPQTLYSAERMQIGGSTTVRGFLDQSITGDQGAYIRNELGWNLPWPEFLQKNGAVSGVQLYMLYDYGFIRRDRHDAFERGRMQGTGIGLRTLGTLSVDMSLTKALEYPAYVRARDTEFYLSLKYTF